MRALGAAPAQVLLMPNHGCLSAGSTVAEAFWNMNLLTRACELQVSALSAVGGRIDELVQPDQSVVDETSNRLQKAFAAQGNLEWGKLEFAAVRRKIQQMQPDHEL